MSFLSTLDSGGGGCAGGVGWGSGGVAGVVCVMGVVGTPQDRFRQVVMMLDMWNNEHVVYKTTFCSIKEGTYLIPP